jgi:serine/threonine protein phosphatase 1
VRRSQPISRATDLGDDGRLIAIGDIHGRLGKLVGLLDQIRPTAADQLVFLGNYIDRGPDSYEVVERLIALRRDLPRTVLLRGNHEQLVLDLLADPTASHRTSWLERDGGALTVASYRAAGHYLPVHRDFFAGLPHSFTTDRYFFCHAGVRPGIPLDQQRPADLLEIREPFLTSRACFGRIVVHGHTVVERPQLLPNRINIDTRAGDHGPLTAIELPSGRLRQQW